VENIDGSRPPNVAGYNIYRSLDAKNFPIVPLNPNPVPAAEFEDKDFQLDQTYFYRVAVVGSLQTPYPESESSADIVVATRDIFPPEAPQNLNGAVLNRNVMLLWMAPEDNDVAGYKIYRRMEGEAQFKLLPQQLVTGFSLRDENLPAGNIYYRVSAIDKHGNEGPAAEIMVEVR
jgi:fibronectin type 3 domain-containing protein